jgi:hypothetical protein
MKDRTKKAKSTKERKTKMKKNSENDKFRRK